MSSPSEPELYEALNMLHSEVREPTGRIVDFISTPISPSARTRRQGKIDELITPVTSTFATAPKQFECRLLSFLVQHRAPLGIARVFRLENLLIDAALTLHDGRFVAVEIKYRMNWLKACQAVWQFGEFKREHEATQHHPVGGIVFFEEFSGDWARRAGHTERGWDYWYRGHVALPGDETFRIDLIQFRNDRLEGMPITATSSMQQ
jgi:hypothetical protein